MVRRLPFAPPSVVARAPPVVYPLKTRHHDASHHNQRFQYNQSATEQTTSATTSLPQSRRPPLQPVCRRADDFHYNRSTAIVLQTTSTVTSPRLSRYGQSNHRTAGAPHTQTQTTITSTSTICRCTADADNNHYNTTIPQYQFTADVPQAIALQTTTTQGVPQMLIRVDIVGGKGPARVTRARKI